MALADETPLVQHTCILKFIHIHIYTRSRLPPPLLHLCQAYESVVTHNNVNFAEGHLDQSVLMSAKRNRMKVEAAALLSRRRAIHARLHVVTFPTVLPSRYSKSETVC